MPIYRNGEELPVTGAILSQWIDEVYIPTIKKEPLNYSATGNGVVAADDAYRAAARQIARYLLKTSIKVDQIDSYVDTLTNYTYYVGGSKVTLSRREILAALVLLCRNNNLKWTLESTAATPYEIAVFKDSNFGKLLIKYGLVGEDIINAETTEDTGVVDNPGEVDAFSSDTAEEQQSEEEVFTDEPTEQPIESEANVEDSTGEAPVGEVSPESETVVTPSEGDTTEVQSQSQDSTEDNSAQPKERKRRKRVTKTKTKDAYYGNITDTTKRTQDPYLKGTDGKYLHYEATDHNGKTYLAKIHVPTGDDKYDTYYDCIETGTKVRGKKVNRKVNDQSVYPKMSPYVTNIISTPLNPLPMDGENGMVYIIKGYGNATSNKCPKAYVMPMSMQINDTRTGEIGPVANPKSKKRINDKGELKVHIAGASTVQNQTLFFNTKAEAQAMLDAILKADQNDIAAGVDPKYLRVPEGVEKGDLTVCGIMLYTKDPHWSNNLRHFTRGFYEIATEFGNAWICARNLFEELAKDGNIIVEQIEFKSEEQQDEVKSSTDG